MFLSIFGLVFVNVLGNVSLSTVLVIFNVENWFVFDLCSFEIVCEVVALQDLVPVFDNDLPDLCPSCVNILRLLDLGVRIEFLFINCCLLSFISLITASLLVSLYSNRIFAISADVLFCFRFLRGIGLS